MKTNNFYMFIIGLTAAFSSLFVSCDDGDTTKPVINLIEPEDGDSLQIGGESGVHFEAEFSDDEALASYKIEIHHNFDGHDHDQLRAASDEETVDFTFEKTYDLSGKKNADVHHHDILIPENATPGDYHLMIYCTDASGNEAHVAVSVVLSHDASEHHHDD
jgi:uncharacterized membrane protein